MDTSSTITMFIDFRKDKDSLNVYPPTPFLSILFYHISFFLSLSLPLPSLCSLSLSLSITSLQAIIKSILISGRLGPNVQNASCYGLRLKHLKSEELHWLHPDLTIGEVEQKYESHHIEAEWRWGHWLFQKWQTAILIMPWRCH